MSAIFSQCGAYRYRLDRVVDMFGGPTICFCLHNPSTADAVSDDPTLRRGIGFARTWGASRLVFVNTWAAVATKPSELWAKADPVGPDNDNYIAQAAKEAAITCGFMVFAWGAPKPPAMFRASVRQRLERVEEIVKSHSCQIKALGFNRDGSPKHPLYVKNSSAPRPWQNERVE